MVAEDFQEKNFFELEDPADFDLLKSTPKTLLSRQKGLVVIDKIQLIPKLFPLLWVLADDSSLSQKFLILRK